MTAFRLLKLLARKNTGLSTSGDHTRIITAEGLERSYLVHLPSTYDAKNAMPVVLAYHAGGTNPQSMMRYSGLNTKADDAGFVVVYPAGTGRLRRALTFNGGNCCGYALRNRIDDVAFTRLLLDDLALWINVDPQRIYATGMSNGGIMAYRVASELSDRIAAIASVCGPMGTDSCSPQHPVSVMHFHGTADVFIPFAGGKGKGVSGTTFYSVEHSIRAWVTANHCDAVPIISELPNVARDGTRVIRTTYGGGKDGAEVVLISIEGGGHTWPGRETRFSFLGTSTHNISANDVLWEFFMRHPMP